MWTRSRVSWRKLTSMFPHVWKAVNKNIKLKPKMMMFKSFLPSGFIIAGFLKKDEPKNVQQKTAHLETEAE